MRHQGYVLNIILKQGMESNISNTDDFRLFLTDSVVKLED